MLHPECDGRMDGPKTDGTFRSIASGISFGRDHLCDYRSPGRLVCNGQPKLYQLAGGDGQPALSPHNTTQIAPAIHSRIPRPPCPSSVWPPHRSNHLPLEPLAPIPHCAPCAPATCSPETTTHPPPAHPRPLCATVHPPPTTAHRHRPTRDRGAHTARSPPRLSHEASGSTSISSRPSAACRRRVPTPAAAACVNGW